MPPRLYVVFMARNWQEYKWVDLFVKHDHETREKIYRENAKEAAKQRLILRERPLDYYPEWLQQAIIAVINKSK